MDNGDFTFAKTNLDLIYKEEYASFTGLLIKDDFRDDFREERKWMKNRGSIWKKRS
ncbi:hypothetical protein BVRB_2g036620 [Beta vulgaris subsp. vulgaris]|nr:hypothetical protein BVRB_2g036620 [Beta vulgaris subsp. vulgaris]